MAVFYLLGILSDVEIMEYTAKMTIMQLSFVLLMLKSIWGLAWPPIFTSTTLSSSLVAFCLILKILLALLLFLLKHNDPQMR
jgi:tryptophan-rich sensory protein